MPHRSGRGAAPLSLVMVILLIAATLTTAIPVADARQVPPEPNPVDLATVPLGPAELPERGFQLGQAGDLEFGALQFSWGEDTEANAWQSIADGFQHGYSMVQVLFSDRGDSRSEPLATVTTMVIGFDSPAAAVDAGPALLEIASYGPTEDVNGVTVYADVDGLLGLRAEGDYLVLVQYAFAAQQSNTRQNTEDWTPESIAGVVNATVEGLDSAIADVGSVALGIANVMVYGPQSPWTLPWIHYPSTEHYRVVDGEAVAYGGELAAELEDVAPDGVDDLFVSRQQIGDERYEHLIDVTLARFDSEAAASAYAAAPEEIIFPPTWTFDPTYSAAEAMADGTSVERVQVDDDALRASGYRSVRQEGELVQVVQWLASGNAVVSAEAIAWLTKAQTSCLEALPEPCAPISQDEVPAALAEGQAAPSPDGNDQATPAADLKPSGVVSSEQFGWDVVLPNEGWELIEREAFTNSEHYQFQSGRSLVTVESVVDHHGDARQCVLDNLALLEMLEDRAVIELGSDDPAERAAGVEQDHAWAIYTVEPLEEQRTDQEYTIRYDCYTLVPGDASLVMTHTAPRDLWTGERDKGARFRDGIRLSQPRVTIHSTPPGGDGRYLGRNLTMGIPRIWIPRAA